MERPTMTIRSRGEVAGRADERSGACSTRVFTAGVIRVQILPTLAPSPLYAGERVRVRGLSASETSGLTFQMQPLTPALSPAYRGEGVRALPIAHLLHDARLRPRASARQRFRDVRR